jgi:hypothetical protein
LTMHAWRRRWRRPCVACGAAQKLLDQLTRAQLTTVVCEQRADAPAGATRVERYVSEVISPHNPK